MSWINCVGFCIASQATSSSFRNGPALVTGVDVRATVTISLVLANVETEYDPRSNRECCDA